ncbi:SDR family NAD(P)-dependent oxidoreductase [Brevibacterium sp. VCM10]|uniref:SDR family NAD(P)-dependent oxidoreductase n=1 Tax=Brevibacterium sp. VCM10 TaxID=1381751 RepID=UPI00046E7806|nr:SDR family NAD(P)-dependent oxidoreductase [Brevibacterium sp. VCM10]
MAQTVLITGCRSGFGTALALAFADAGWNVAATMREPNRAPADLSDRDDIAVLRLDVTDTDSIAEAVAATQERFGPLDAVVNAAGFVVQGTLEELALDDLRSQFETNVIGTAALVQAVLPGMRERRHGHILTFSSGAGLVGMPRIEAYAASKFAVEGMSESLQRSVDHLGVKVTIVEPGVFSTELGNSVVTPKNPVADYDPSAAQAADLYDWTPGDLAGAARAIASVAGESDAPLRLYVGHGLDDVRRHYRNRLDEWQSREDLTSTTLGEH